MEKKWYKNTTLWIVSITTVILMVVGICFGISLGKSSGNSAGSKEEWILPEASEIDGLIEFESGKEAYFRKEISLNEKSIRVEGESQSFAGEGEVIIFANETENEEIKIEFAAHINNFTHTYNYESGGMDIIHSDEFLYDRLIVINDKFEIQSKQQTFQKTNGHMEEADEYGEVIYSEDLDYEIWQDTINDGKHLFFVSFDNMVMKDSEHEDDPTENYVGDLTHVDLTISDLTILDLEKEEFYDFKIDGISDVI